MQVSCFIVESIIRLGNIEFLFLNGPPSFRIDQKALCIVTRTVKMISRNEWSLFCVTLYYFEDFGNIPIHSYITNSWQETIASPCSKILLFSTDKCWDTRSVISHSTPLWSDITAVILTRMTENTEFISDLNSNFGNLS